MTETAAEKARRSRLKRLYNITPEEYDDILRHQANVCFICERPPGRSRLAVDHEHKTGLIRGLLCWQCNAAIAKLGDNARRAGLAWEYLVDPPAWAALGSARYGRTGRTTTRAKRRKKASYKI